MQASVFYWTNIKYIHGIRPTPGEVETDYRLIWSGEVPEDTKLDDVFADLNTEFNLTGGVPELPEGVRHTSMSVGDIVALNGKFFICLPIGWDIL